MPHIKFRIGSRFLYQEHACIILDKIGLKFIVQDLTAGIEFKNTYRELFNLWVAGDIRHEVVGRNTYQDDDRPLTTRYTYADFSSLGEKANEAWRRYEIIMKIYRFYSVMKLMMISREKIQRWIDTEHPSREAPKKKRRSAIGKAFSAGSIERWMRGFVDSNGSLISLVDQRELQGGKGDTRLKTPDSELIIQEVFEDCKNNRKRRTPEDIFDEIEDRIQRENQFRKQEDQLVVPSPATLYRRMNNPWLRELLLRRPRTRLEAQKEEQVKEAPEALWLLHMVRFDTFSLKFWVVDLEDRLPLGIPRGAIGIDQFTRMPYGWSLGFEGESAWLVLRALRHGAFPKPDTQALYGTRHAFDVHGLPDMAITDNGKGFINNYFAYSLAQAGVIHQPVHIKSPWENGIIERFIRTSRQGLLSGIDGSVSGDIYDWRNHNPKDYACVSFAALPQIMHLFYLDHYAERWHNGIQDIPARRYEAEMAKGFEPVMDNGAKDLEMKLLPSKLRQVEPTGIPLETLLYNSPELARIRKYLNGEPIRAHFNPDELGFMLINDPMNPGADPLEIPAVNQDYTRGLSIYKHRVIRRFVLKKKGYVDIEGLKEAKAHIKKIIAKELGLTLKGRKSSHRAALARYSGLTDEQKSPSSIYHPSLSSQSNSGSTMRETPPPPPSEDILDDFVPSSRDGWGGDYNLPK